MTKYFCDNCGREAVGHMSDAHILFAHAGAIQIWVTVEKGKAVCADCIRAAVAATGLTKPDDLTAQSSVAIASSEPSLPHECAHPRTPQCKQASGHWCKFCDNYVKTESMTDPCPARQLHDWSVMNRCLRCGAQGTPENYSEPCPKVGKG